MRWMNLSLCLLVCVAVNPARAEDARGDGMADGKKSLGGSGEIVSFSRADSAAVPGIRIHGSRYGVPQAPAESFLIYFMSPDLKRVLHTEMADYSLFERGPEKWVEVKFAEPVPLPQDFSVIVDFRAGRTKGVYVSFDTSTGGKFSQAGLPGIAAKPVDFGGDWMIDLLAK